ncbi:DUF551 domain-containing protein [Methylobacter sp.]|uniref:DUF551 domain-containing protein n=1 Tax=Methylobacter sp. TaxID=2051955 RepID=UPI003520E5F0
MEWQPIETAPANTVVDLFVPWIPNRAGFKGFRYTDCYRRGDGQWTSKNFDSEKRRTVNNPSHWMLLPEPPNNELRTNK